MPFPAQLALLNRERQGKARREPAELARMRMPSLAEEVERMGLSVWGGVSLESRRRLAEFEEQRERENVAAYARQAGNVRIYLDYEEGRKRELAQRGFTDLSRVREYKRLLSEREFLERMVLGGYSRAKAARLLAEVRKRYPEPPQAAASLKRKSVVVINRGTLNALVRRAKAREAFARALVVR